MSFYDDEKYSYDDADDADDTAEEEDEEVLDEEDEEVLDEEEEEEDDEDDISSTATTGSSSSSSLRSGSSTSTTGVSSSSSVRSGSSTSTTGVSSSSTVNSGSSTAAIDNSAVSFFSNTSEATTGSYIYTGEDQVISNYQSGEKIALGTMPTGYIFSDGNFALGSDTGTLLIQNAYNKRIDLTDGEGNDVAQAYVGTNPGVIDGRGLSGFEYIIGSDAGTDIIYAGDDDSQMWGGFGNGADILVGGAGADMFVGGKYQGADTFMNASSDDVVFLNDTTLSDIVATGESNGTIAIAFNTGNVVAIQSSEALSAAVVLADGSAWRYNHANKSWQNA